MTAADRPRVLVVGPSWVGDLVMAQGAIAGLLRREPGAVVDVVAPPGPLRLAPRMPGVRRGIPLAVGHGELGFRARRRLARELRGAYDRAYVLPLSWKAALVPALAGIPERIGGTGEHRYGLLTRRVGIEAATPTFRGYERLLGSGETPVLQVDPMNQAALIEVLGLQLDRPVATLIPGAAWGPSKRWPVQRFVQLTRELLQGGFAVWVLGAPAEAPLAAPLQAVGAIDLCGRSGLCDAVDLLALSSVAVVGDSGLMHVAGAVGCPVVALYGPTSPERTPPLGARHAVVERSLGCRPCYRAVCPLTHGDCLAAIQVAEVRAAIDGLLSGATAGRSTSAPGSSPRRCPPA